jgi:hypothetical protein
MRRLLALLTLFCFCFAAAPAFAGDVRVRPHVRRDGTYVPGHWRSAPDGNRDNNWSTQGNVNPYTGERGTRRPESEGIYPKGRYQDTPWGDRKDRLWGDRPRW